MTLDSAAKKYLNKSKIDIETKTFSKRYVKNNFEKIKKYCIQDANLTLELANYLLDKLEEFGITASKVYSCASISFQYFCEQKAITTVWRYWKYPRPPSRFTAMDRMKYGTQRMMKVRTSVSMG